jgi:two-component system chemotaxis response regulator CheY
MARKILIVEDENDIRNLYGLLMRSTGYEVIEACDGKDALEKFTAAPCELVITDMNMPRMGGLELIKELRRRSSQVHIILITGYGTLETEKRAFSLGSDEYMPKPFDMQELLDRVNEYFNGK